MSKINVLDIIIGNEGNGGAQSKVIQVQESTLTQQLENNTIYDCGEMTAIEVTLPSTPDASFISQLDFTSGATPTSLTAPNGIKWSGDDAESSLVPEANTRYVVLFYFDGLYWRAMSQAVEYTAPANS